MSARKSDKPIETEQEAPELVGAGLGQVAFTAYTGAMDPDTADEDYLPIWENLIKEKPAAAAAWCASAQAVLTATFERNPSK